MAELGDSVDSSARSFERLSGLLGRYPRLAAVAGVATLRIASRYLSLSAAAGQVSPAIQKVQDAISKQSKVVTELTKQQALNGVAQTRLSNITRELARTKTLETARSVASVSAIKSLRDNTQKYERLVRSSAGTIKAYSTEKQKLLNNIRKYEQQVRSNTGTLKTYSTAKQKLRENTQKYNQLVSGSTGILKAYSTAKQNLTGAMGRLKVAQDTNIKSSATYTGNIQKLQAAIQRYQRQVNLGAKTGDKLAVSRGKLEALRQKLIGVQTASTGVTSAFSLMAIGGALFIGTLAAIAAGLALVTRRGMAFANVVEDSELQLRFLAKRTYDSRYGLDQWGKSASFATTHMAKLRMLARESPLDLRGVLIGTTVLENFGGSLLNNTRFLEKFIDTVSILKVSIGAGAEGVREIARQVGQLFSNLRAGRAFGQDARILTQRGVMSPESWTKLNIVLKEIQDEGIGGTEEAAIRAATAIEEMFEGLKGGAEASSETITGLTEKFVETFDSAAADFVEKTGLRTFWAAVLQTGVAFFEANELSPFERLVEQFGVQSGGLQGRLGTASSAYTPQKDVIPGMENMIYAMGIQDTENWQFTPEQLEQWNLLRNRIIAAGHSVEDADAAMFAAKDAAKLLADQMARIPNISMEDDGENALNKRLAIIEHVKQRRERAAKEIERINEKAIENELGKHVAVIEHIKQRRERDAEQELNKRIAIVEHIQQRRERAETQSLDKRRAIVEHIQQRRERDASNELNKQRAITEHYRKRRELATRSKDLYDEAKLRAAESIFRTMEGSAAKVAVAFYDAYTHTAHLEEKAKAAGIHLREGAKELAGAGAAISHIGGQIGGVAGSGISAVGGILSALSTGSPVVVGLAIVATSINFLKAGLDKNTEEQRKLKAELTQNRGALGLATEEDKARWLSMSQYFHSLEPESREKKLGSMSYGRFLADLEKKGVNFQQGSGEGRQAQTRDYAVLKAYKATLILIKDIRKEEERRLRVLNEIADAAIDEARMIRSELVSSYSLMTSVLEQMSKASDSAFDVVSLDVAIDRMQELGLLTRDVADAYHALADAAHVNWREMIQLTDQFDIGQGHLGAGFSQAKTTGLGGELAKAFSTLTDAGGDPLRVAVGLMKTALDEDRNETGSGGIEKLITEALASGALIPHELKPALEALAANNVMSDQIAKVQYGDPLGDTRESLHDLLSEVSESIHEAAITEADQIIRSIEDLRDTQIEAAREQADRLIESIESGQFSPEDISTYLGRIVPELWEIAGGFGIGFSEPSGENFLFEDFLTQFKLDLDAFLTKLIPDPQRWASLVDAINASRGLTPEDIAALAALFKAGFTLIIDGLNPIIVGVEVSINANIVAINNLKLVFIKEMGEIRDTLVEKQDGLKTVYTSKIGEVKDTLVEKQDELKAVYSDEMGDVRDTLVVKQDELKAVYSDEMGDVRDTLVEKQDELKAVYSDEMGILKAQAEGDTKLLLTGMELSTLTLIDSATNVGVSLLTGMELSTLALIDSATNVGVSLLTGMELSTLALIDSDTNVGVSLLTGMELSTLAIIDSATNVGVSLLTGMELSTLALIDANNITSLIILGGMSQTVTAINAVEAAIYAMKGMGTIGGVLTNTGNTARGLSGVISAINNLNLSCPDPKPDPDPPNRRAPNNPLDGDNSPDVNLSGLTSFPRGALINFGGRRAMGGPVSEGIAYQVGEQGPEIFTPKMNGNITPFNSNIRAPESSPQTMRHEIVMRLEDQSFNILAQKVFEVGPGGLSAAGRI